MADGMELSFLDMLGVIRDNYPQYWAFVQKPGVFDVIIRGIHEQWSPAKLLDGIKHTPYFLNTPVAQREWDNIAAFDPATAQQRAKDADRMVQDTARQLGIDLQGDDGWRYMIDTAINGWDQNRLRYEMLMSNKGLKGPDFGEVGGGREVAQIAGTIRARADAYGIPLTDDNTLQWARQVAAGTMTPQAIDGSLQQWASSLFPVLAPQIQAGRTVADIATPYLQMFAQETGNDVSSVMLSDPKWTNLMIATDDKGAQRIRTPMETTRLIRTDPQYGWDTSAPAIKTAAQIGMQLQKLMGISG